VTPLASRFDSWSPHVRPYKHQCWSPAGSSLLLIISVIGAFLAILGAGLTHDPIFRLQAGTVALAGVIAAFVLNGGLAGGTLRDHPDQYSDNVVKAGVIAITDCP